MKTTFDQSFYKSLEKLSDAGLKQKIANIIREAEVVNEISDIRQIKKMKGYKYYYRIKLGDYRIGFELKNTDTINFILVSH
ncbi:MAG: plasmid stabilization protein [Daejeonella sp.]